MSRKKNIYKIGLSLLIAALFVFTAMSAIGNTITTEKGEASDIIETTRDKRTTETRATNGVDSLAPPFMVNVNGLYIGDTEVTYGATNILASGTYPITVSLMNDGPPVMVKAFAEVYKKCCGEEVLLYETSFEDNFDIYNNWMQIDLDCGQDPDLNTGFFDTWTWTDARAYCDDHSFKNTMYDIYKGNQDDYLMCTKSFDVRDQYGTKVNFKIWVEGSGEIVYALTPGPPDQANETYSIYDFLNFEVGDWNGNWVNPYNINTHDMPNGDPTYDEMVFIGDDLNILDGGYYFWDTTLPIYTYSPYTNYYPKATNLGGGWWDVEFDVPNWYLEFVLGLDLEDIMFRFSWHSDPQFQFEGAYVDCFEVWSLEDCEEKVFQTHSQGPFEVPYCDPQQDGHQFKFPLEFDFDFVDECGRKETCYDVVVWLQVLDQDIMFPLHGTLHDWDVPQWWIDDMNPPELYPGPQDYLVCVGDYYDVCVENLEIETSYGGRPVPPEGIMYEGEDAHIIADVHIKGTLPAENIVIDAYAQKKEWQEVFFSDCENALSWPDMVGFVHMTDEFSWSGNKCIGFFDETENEYPVDDSAYVLGPTIDVEDYEELILDFYTMFATEFEFDELHPVLLDPYANYILGRGYHQDHKFTHITGWSGAETDDIGDKEDWIGPMQPRSMYHLYDLKDQYNYYLDQGFFRDPDGNAVTETQVGFVMLSDAEWYGDSEDNHHPNQLVGWSGVCIDDVSIRGLKVLDEKIWQDQIIIPGPCEPSETCEVQFEWEDVPFSNYKITVESKTEGACLNFECAEQSQQIMVITNLEQAHYKEVDSVDLTGLDGGPWGRCGSDYDWYLSSNPDSLFYPPFSDYAATLCLDGVPCLDISDYFGGGGVIPTVIFYEDFETACPGLWTTSEGIAPNSDVWACSSMLPWWPLTGGGVTGTWMEFDDDGYGSLSDNGWEELISPPIDCTMATNCMLDFDGYFEDMAGWGEFYVFVNDGVTDHQVFFYTADHPGFDTEPAIDISTEADGNIIQLKFVYSDWDIPPWDYSAWAWGAGVDNILVSGDTLVPSVPPTDLFIDFEGWWDMEMLYGDYVELSVANCIYEDGHCCGDDGYCCPDELLDWTPVAYFMGNTELMSPSTDGWIPVNIDLTDGFGPMNPMTEHICVRFVLHGGPITARGMLIDDLSIYEPVSGDIIFGVDVDGDGELDPDPMDTMDNYCFDVIHYGQYWEYIEQDCCGTPSGWFNTIPALPVNDALVWTTEIADAYEAYLSILLAYSLSGTTTVYVEISDNGGADWFILAEYTGSSGGCITDEFNLNFWVGKPVLIRVRVFGGLSPGGGSVQVCDMSITGKEDNVAPTSSIQMSGTMKDSGWYSTAVQVKITAEDQGSGVKEIHVVVDGQETVYPGDTAQFTINGNGFHDISYWAVDNVGNAENAKTVPTFKIDAGAAPTVAITAPEPGLYLFGNKLLSSSKVFIIGAFTVEANAEDADSGIYKVSFYLDDELLGEDTEAPFSQYVATKHMGAGTIKVVAEDFAQNVAEDTLDVTYYKFF